MFNLYRKTYVEINLENIYSNFKSVEKILNGKTVIPVVKANAYGHGMIEVSKYLYSKNIDYFAVSLLEEALELRSTLPNIDILVMGVVYPDQLEMISSKNITFTLSNDSLLDKIISFNKPLKLHLKVDTGMNRLGFKNFEKAKQVLEQLSKNKFVNVEGVYTHFATADCDDKYYKKQTNLFDDFINMVNYDFQMIHVSNSSSSIKYETDIKYSTHVRLGISLYGLTLDSETKFLKNTFRLITHVAEFKYLKKDEYLGYGATYQASEDEIIGILPIGYADGLLRNSRDSNVE
ncbi:MAG: alanine racemase, partial [Candidatus Izemoplasma sp.]